MIKAKTRDLREFFDLEPEMRQVILHARHARDWDHLGPIAQRLTQAHNIPVCYITTDASDPTLIRRQSNLFVFLGSSNAVLRKFYRHLEARVLITASPCFGGRELPIPRHPKLRKLLLLTNLNSVHTTYLEAQLQPYDAFLCCGPHHVAELTAIFGDEKRTYPLGSAHVDALLGGVLRSDKPFIERKSRQILLAPESDALLTRHGKNTIRTLLDQNYFVTTFLSESLPDRRGLQKGLRKQFGKDALFDIAQHKSLPALLAECQAVITDAAHVGFIYALGLERTPVIIEPSSARCPRIALADRRPFEVEMRRHLGTVVAIEDTSTILSRALTPSGDDAPERERLASLRDAMIFNPDASAHAGAELIAKLHAGLLA